MGTILDNENNSQSNEENKKQNQLKHFPRKINYKLSQVSKDYFSLISKFNSKNYVYNLDNKDNVSFALERKSFSKTNYNEQEASDYINWETHLLNFLYEQPESSTWAPKLIEEIDEEVFFDENKYLSSLFYNDFLIQTQPKVLQKEDEEDKHGIKESQPIIRVSLTNKNYNNMDGNLKNSANYRNSNAFGMNNYTELNVTADLGGSFRSIDTDNLLEGDPMIEFKANRKNAKKYVKIFSEQISKHDTHPIAIVIRKFGVAFTEYLTQQNESIKQMKKQQQNENDDVSERIKNTVDSITKELQQFILTLESTMKLFYCKVIDYSCFSEEKDDLINFLTCQIFKSGHIYEKMMELYSYKLENVIKNLEEKFTELADKTPYHLGIHEKFCLNKETIALQKKLKKEKEEKERKKREEENKKAETMNPNRNTNKLLNNNDNLEAIKEDEDMDEDKDDEKEKTNLVDESNQGLIEDEKNKSTDNITPKLEKVDLKGLPLISEENEENEKKDNPDKNGMMLLYGRESNINNTLFIQNQNASRYTVNLFNNKQFNFPNLHSAIRQSVGLLPNTGNIPLKDKSEPLQPPYSSAVKMLCSIKKYRTPFEKMLVIASISDEITQCVDEFWKGTESFIKPTYLSIEADELMTIVLYIIIKSNMSELSLYAELIQNFTTEITRGTTLGYYYANLQASLAYIEELENAKNLIKREEQLKNAKTRLSVINFDRMTTLK